MPRYVYVVSTCPLDGREDEYNRWYDDQHLGDVLNVPGIVKAERFSEVPVAGTQPAIEPYLALYSVETDDIEGVHREIKARAGTEAMPMNPAVDRERLHASYFQAITVKPEPVADKPVLEIRYCASCGYIARALWVAAELMPDVQYDISDLRIVPGDKGVFEVSFGGQSVFNKAATGRFPDPIELRQRIFEEMEARA